MRPKTTILAAVLLVCLTPGLSAAQAPGAGVSNEWIVAGFVGSDFGQNADEASLDFGGSLSYLRDGRWGAEFLAGFSPGFELDRTIGFDSALNNYMVNGIAALPLRFGQWQPFVSAGLGAMTLSVDRIDDDGDLFDDITETRFAGNIGGGVMAFGDRWGVRGDLRYLRAFEENVDTDGDDINLLSGVDFWRANIGLAYRW
jgi:opacity protein-like surface antigen